MSWIFAPLYDRIMRPTEDACLGEWRTETLAHARGAVLEIGAGTGASIPHYPDVESVTFCEPDAGMRRQLEQRLTARQTWDHRIVDAVAEKLPFADASFDTVVSMLVLCTVDQPDSAVRELHRVLKPDGVLLFVEHVAAESGSPRRRWQHRIEPIWKRLAGGCHITRDTESTIARHFALDELRAESMRKAISVVRPAIRGVARPK